MDNYVEHFSTNIDENGNIEVIEKIYKISKYSHQLSEKINAVFKEHASQNLHALLLENLYIKFFITRILYNLMFQPIIPKRENSQNNQLQIVLRIYNLLSFKDNFNRKFLYHICNRVIEKTFPNMNESVFSQIKDVFCEDFFLTLSRIVDDYKCVLLLNTNYKNKIGRNNQPDFSFTMNAVRSELWPYDSDKPIKLPIQLEREYYNFEKFYKSEHPNRKLSFINQDSSGIINFTLNENTYKLHLNAYQLAVFFMFNNIDYVHISEISEKTHISLPVINECLIPFVHSNILILDEVFKYFLTHNTKIYHLNLKFRDEKNYISLAKLPSKNIKQNLMIVPNNIPELTDDGQKIATKCLICQIIKKHGEIDFNKLIIELNQKEKYRFMINTSTVIEQLEELKSREFIRSKSDNPNVYTYIP
ncbi:LOW QUALITY PROTEIN: hypothetical protein MXB_2824 [Myxobolus squamalis]|nr:LOW QUALITY PROTEIN: hypothetical protein MXB_2824 [Myxobolus squamalis]